MRLVLLCSVFAFLLATAPADAQRPAASAKPPAAAKKTNTVRKPAPPPPDTRPILRRDETAAAIPIPAQPTAKPKKRTARKPADAARGAAAAPQTARAGAKDVSECGQVREPDRVIAGCTLVIEDSRQKPKARAAAYYNRGNAHSSKGEHDKAIADFDEAIKLDPKNAIAYNNRGNAHNDKGDADAALADFSAAIKQNARFASGYFNRANVFAAKGEITRAIEDYSKALRFNPRNINAYIARGALHLASGAAAKARDDMKLAARLERKNAYAVLWQDIAERRAKQKGVLAGGKGLKNVEMNGWPAPVLLMFSGELKADGVLVAADDTNAALKEAHTCEANFYSGQHALIGGNRDEAVKMFRTAAKDCPRGFLEGIAASAELKGLGEKL